MLAWLASSPHRGSALDMICAYTWLRKSSLRQHRKGEFANAISDLALSRGREGVERWWWSRAWTHEQWFGCTAYLYHQVFLLCRRWWCRSTLYRLTVPSASTCFTCPFFSRLLQLSSPWKDESGTTVKLSIFARLTEPMLADNRLEPSDVYSCEACSWRLICQIFNS